MINHIDLGTVLRRTVCDLYSDLVTRPTGAAVRSGIEQQLADAQERTLTVIDFTHVGLLDYSCADEIVAKLLVSYCEPAGERGGASRLIPPRDCYFLFKGVSDSHLDAIDAVLQRRGLALVAQTDDGMPLLIGTVDDRERRAWEAVTRLGRAMPADIAGEVGLEEPQAEVLLNGLSRRRLIMRFDEGYVAVGTGP
ncbi:MAG TPA: hypothetical protein VJ650_11420 [Gemmatimonadaceae bacterium]|nr:hypothetical protein [Gemmatimonadaceae bacterium]